MTFDEIVDNALSRAMDFGTDFPSTRRTMYRRIEVREQDLFTQAGRVNPDYFGVNTLGTLSPAGDVDFATLDAEGSTVDPATAITRVEIEDPGTHPTLQCDDEVTIVSSHDPDAGLAPRMWLRNFVLHAYGDDLDGVVSVCVYYSYRPAPRTTPMDGTETAELPSVYQELLVLDLTQWLLKQSLSMDPDRKQAALGVLSQEEADMLARFMGEVADFAGGQVSRFGSVAGGQRL
jgi:hypothetical protein